MSRAKIAVWTLPDDGRPWYAIADYPLAVLGVLIELAGVTIMQGHLSNDSRTGRLAWHEYLPGAGVSYALVPYRAPAQGPSLDRRYPSGWRPLDGVPFPHPLPKPLLTPAARAAVAVEMPDDLPLPEPDGWPHPGCPLGCATPPVSAQETEARVLRAVRTNDATGRVGHIARTTSGDWPRHLFEAMRRMQLVLAIDDAIEARDNNRDSHIGDVRVLWQPTRRDQGDWVYALDWLRPLTDAERRLIAYRAANPPWSWRQIAEQEKGAGNKDTARTAYHTTINRIFTVARKAPA